MTGLWGGIAALLLAAALAAALGAALACICGPVDVPNERSSHARPRLRAGGLSLLLGGGAALLALAWGAAPDVRALLGADTTRLALILAVCGVAGLLGLLDDLSLLGLGAKFAAMVGVAVLATLAVGPVTLFVAEPFKLILPWLLGLAGSILWVFIIMNAVNFMDGADGMMAVSMGVSGAMLALFGAAWDTPVAMVCGVLLAGGLIGFAPFNAPRARVFAGDSGALFAAVLFAAGTLDLTAANPGLAWVAPLLIAPFLADVFITLFDRALRGANLTQAHREHLYQLVTARGLPHWAAASIYAAAVAACAAIAALALRQGSLAALGAMGVIGIAAAILTPLLRRRFRTPG